MSRYGAVDYESMFTCNRVRVTSRLRSLELYLIHNELDFFIIWKFTSDFNDSSLCFLTKTANISPVEFFSALHRPLEQSILHKYLIILRMYWVVVSKSVSTGINLFDYTVQCYSVGRRLLPSFYCVIWKYIWKLWHLEADSVGGSVAGLTKDFAVVNYLISCLRPRELRGWSV